MNAKFDEDWFYGYAPRDEVEFVSESEHRVNKVDSRNVVGRFRDVEVLDGPASRSARRSVYTLGIVLETRALRTANGGGTDISGQPIRFDHEFAFKSIASVLRFKAAWEAYSTTRKAPVSNDEAEALADHFQAPAPKQAPKARKPRAGRTAENVVPLVKASA